MKFLLLFVSLLISGVSYSQDSGDTLADVKQMNASQQFKLAMKTIEKYCSCHPNDFYGFWIMGQTCYWMKHPKKAKAAYERALVIEPNNVPLKKDYFIFLVNIGELKDAKLIAKEYEESTDAEVLLSIAKLSYYEGDYANALHLLQRIKTAEKKLADAILLQNSILNIISPSLKLEGFFQKDDQPLSQITSSLEANYYKNHLLFLTLNYSTPTFLEDNGNRVYSLFKLGNKLNFFKQRAFVYAEAGAVHSFREKKSNLIATVESGKTFFKQFELKFKYDRQPYFFTLNSLNSLLMNNQYSFQFNWNKANSFNSNTTWDVNNYTADNNFVFSFGTWILTPSLKNKYFELRIGYSFNYATSSKDEFTSKESLPFVIANYNNNIEGMYSSYFTPHKQQMHSALLTINSKINNYFDFSINSNIGIYGSAETPYLYLDKNTEGDIILQKAYSLQTFFPLEFKGKLNCRINSQLSINAEYLYRKNNFYTSNYFGLMVIKRFLK
ncbi:MAG: tetratricopeptide repeat protein [Bacteroidia bacterium]